jgi:hypothetical protein
MCTLALHKDNCVWKLLQEMNYMDRWKRIFYIGTSRKVAMVISSKSVCA